MSIQIKALSGEAAHPYLNALARLRIQVFREWPYLYDGDLDYERDYLRTFLAAPDRLLVLALEGERVVGASTGLPLAAETDNIRAPWAEAGYEVEKIFYYGESVLEKAYRGQGLGVRFFEEREAGARGLNRFDRLTFCAVQRPDDHPRRPAGYVPLDSFWRRRGFQPTDLYCYLSWQDLDEAEESPKPLRFWTKTV